jgi:hypothetical protein
MNDVPVFASMTTVGENLRIIEQNGILFLAIDLGVGIGLSASGKMLGVASTGGFTTLPVKGADGKAIKLNLYTGVKA